MSEIRTILQDYVATANHPVYGGDWDIINGKFPELAEYDPKLLQDYVATANNQMYGGNWNIINNKFPEFFPKANSPTYVAPEQKDYGMVDQKTQEDFIDAEFWDNEEHKYYRKREDHQFIDGEWYYIVPEDHPLSGRKIKFFGKALDFTPGAKIKLEEGDERIEILDKEISDYQEHYLQTNVTYENVHLGENPFKSDDALSNFVKYVNDRKGTLFLNPDSDWETVKNSLGQDLKQWVSNYTKGSYVNEDGETIETGELTEDMQPSQDAYDYEYRNKYVSEGVVPIISDEEEREILGDNYNDLNLDLDKMSSEYHESKKKLGESIVMDRSKADPNNIIKPDIKSEKIAELEKLIREKKKLGIDTTWHEKQLEKYKKSAKGGSIDNMVIDGIFKENRPDGTKHYWRIVDGKKELLGVDGSPAEKHYNERYGKAKYIVNWDNKIKEIISVGISADNLKLLYKRPELYWEQHSREDLYSESGDLHYHNYNPLYTADKDRKRNVDDVFDDVTLDDLDYFLKENPEQFPEHRKEYDDATNAVKRIYDYYNGVYYVREEVKPFLHEKTGEMRDYRWVREDWHPATPESFIEKWEEYQKRKENAIIENNPDYFDAELEKKFRDYRGLNDYDPSAETYFNDRDLQFDTDFEEAVKETQADFEQFYQERIEPLYIDITEDINNEWKGRFKENEKGQIVDQVTNKVVTEKDIDEMFAKEIKNRAARHPDIIKLEAQNKQLYRNTLMDYQEKWKPTFNLIPEATYQEWANILNTRNWHTKTETQRRSMIYGLWSEVVKDLYDVPLESEEERYDFIMQRKHEFFNWFYWEGGFHQATNLKGEMSQYALSEMTSYIKERNSKERGELVREFHENRISSSELGELKNAANENISPLVPLDDPRRKELKLAEERLKEYESWYWKWRKKRSQVNQIDKWSKDVIEEADLRPEDVDSFWEGIASLEGIEYVPFISGFAELGDARMVMKIAKKLDSGEVITQQEKDLLQLYQLKNVTEERTREMSHPLYGAGKLTAQMLPYVLEFIMTSGAFTGAKALTRLGLSKLIVGSAKATSKSFAKKWGKKKITSELIKESIKKGVPIISKGADRAVSFLSWVAGTAAHTGANPQRYITETFKNMTPEMKMVMSEEGDELITAISAQGDDFGKAFLKGFGVTWAEFATERLGELIPVLGKYIKGKLPLHTQEWMERMLLSRFARKMGWDNLGSSSKWLTEKTGWNGLIGEIFEETVNQPVSNLINGDKWNEGMDGRFFSELGISMGFTSLLFGGLSLATSKNKNNASIYEINDSRFTRDEFMKRIGELEKAGRLNNPNYKYNIKITNNNVLGEEVGKILNKYKDKGNSLEVKETNLRDTLTATHIETLNHLDPESRETTEQLEDEAEETKQKIKELRSTLKHPSKSKKIKKLKQRLLNIQQDVSNITDQVSTEVGWAKRYNAYFDRLSGVEKILTQLGWRDDTDIQEAVDDADAWVRTYNDQQRVKKGLLDELKSADKPRRREIEKELTEIGKYERIHEEMFTFDKKNKTWKLKSNWSDASGIQDLKGKIPARIKKLQQKKKLTEKEAQILEDFNTYMEVTQSHGHVSGDKKTIILNKKYALSEEGGNVNVAAHEFLHKALVGIFKKNPAMQLAFGHALHGHLMDIDPGFVSNSDFQRRLQAYHYSYGAWIKESMKIQQMKDIGKLKNDKKMLEEAVALEKKLIENIGKEEAKGLNASQAEEALTLLSDAIALGELEYNPSFWQRIGDLIRRILSSYGHKVRFGSGRDVFNFIRDFNQSIEKGEMTKGMVKTLQEGAVIKGEIKKEVENWEEAFEAWEQKDREGIKASKAAGYDVRKIMGEARRLYSKAPGDLEKLVLAANTKEIVRKNEKLRERILALDIDGTAERDNNGKIIIPDDIQAELVDNNEARAVALAYQAELGAPIALEKGKRKGFDDFFPEFYLKLNEMAGTYNPELVPFGAYMNTYLPLKYEGILEHLKRGEIEDAVNADSQEAKNIRAEKESIVAELTKLSRKELGDRLEEANIEADFETAELIREAIRAKMQIKLYERFGEEAENINYLIQEYLETYPGLLEDLTDLDLQNQEDITPLETIQMIVGKDTEYKDAKGNPTGQLMATRILDALQNNKDLNQQDIKAIQRWVNTHADTLISMLPQGFNAAMESTGVATVLLKHFYNKSTKRSKNNYPQYKKPVIDTIFFKKVMGIMPGKQKNITTVAGKEGKSQLLKALVSLVGKMMTHQAVREYHIKNGTPAETMRTFQDGKSGLLFSKGVSKLLPPASYKFHNRLPKLARAYYKHGKSIERAFNLVYPGDIFGEHREQILKDLKRYINTYTKAKVLHDLTGKRMISLENYLTEKTMNQVMESNLRALLDQGKNSMDFSNQDQIESVITALAKVAEKMGWEKTQRFLSYIYSTGKMGKTSLMYNTETGKYEYDPRYWQKKIDKITEQIDNYEAKNPGKKDTKKRKTLAKYIENQEEFKEPADHPYGILQSSDVFSEVILKGLEKYKPGLKNSILKNTKQNVLVDVSTKEKALENEASAKRNQEFLIEFMETLGNLMKLPLDEGGISKNDFGMIMLSLTNSGMNTPLAAAARVAYTTGGKITKETHRYEHVIPRKIVALYLANYALDPSASNLKDLKQLFESYVVAIIPKDQDTIINNAGYRDSMPNSWILGADPLQRYYNTRTFGRINLQLKDVLTQKGVTKYNTFNEVYDIVGENHYAGIIINNAMQFSRRVNPTKGISVWDFDDTIARTKSGVRYTLPNPNRSPQAGRKVIFMAGAAGAGKSSVIRKLKLEEQGFKIVNQDIALEWLSKNSGLPTDMRDFTQEQAKEWGKLTWEARRIAIKKQSKYQGRGDGIIVDGTGASLANMKAQVQEFQNKGYDVQMLFVETELETALERNRARKERSLRDNIVLTTWQQVLRNKEAFKKLFGKRFAEVQTDNLTQEDPMPKGLVKKVDSFTKGYIKGRLDAGEFADKGADLKKQGAEFDFTEFDVVKEGEKGPLFGKAINRAKKFGTKDQFILTARPKAAQEAIYLWLQAQGLNIPLENIAALEDSTSEAKALWVAEKVGEGYNDFYFADDAIQNVQAVQNMLDQFDVKSKVQQAKYKYSKAANGVLSSMLQNAELDINRILEQTEGVTAGKRYSAAQAKIRGSKKGRWKFWVPPSAEDFKGLIYNFIGKGVVGDRHMAFFEKFLFKPYARAYSEINSSRQKLHTQYKALLRKFPEVKKVLSDYIGDSNFTYDQAIRVYLWNKAGFEIPGLSKRDLNLLLSAMEDPKMKDFAETLGLISKQKDGYVVPGEYWTIENIQSDLNRITAEIDRADALSEWKQNVENIFGVWDNGKLVGENMNKIEAIYGTNLREALEDILWRMEFNTSRTRGTNKLVNRFNNWANQSVGAIMFFNMRSALLQTISSINFINWSDNNPLKAGLALANIPQFCKDFAMIFNSDMLKQRRAGQQRGINEAELAEAVGGAKNGPKAILNYLLTKGFLPTQIADSFAIASGGATFYRNRVNSLMKQGLTEEQAKERAWQDFQEIAEETQQSARPDLISQQQASPLGRYILAFKNTPMQYARLVKKAFRDLKNGRGDAKTNISKIIYYMAVQNFIFSSMQQALFAMVGSDDEERDAQRMERTAWSMFDSIFYGLGIGGTVVVAIKNAIMEFIKQEGKGWGADHTMTIIKLLGFSPTIGSKIRKIYSAIQEWVFNKDVMGERGFTLDNPLWNMIANIISGFFNIPLDRLIRKAQNIEAAITSDLDWWQRLALILGWNTWDLDIKDQDLLDLKEEIKERKKEEREKEREEEKKQKKIKEEKVNQEKEEKLIEEDMATEKETYYCPNIRDGVRCKMEVENPGDYCTYHEDVPQREDGKKERCTAKKTNGEQCKNMTANKSGLCYIHD